MQFEHLLQYRIVVFVYKSIVDRLVFFIGRFIIQNIHTTKRHNAQFFTFEQIDGTNVVVVG